MENDHMVLVSYNDIDLELVDTGNKEKMQGSFNECITNGDGESYYLVKILLQAALSYEIEVNDDADE